MVTFTHGQLVTNRYASIKAKFIGIDPIDPSFGVVIFCHNNQYEGWKLESIVPLEHSPSQFHHRIDA